MVAPINGGLRGGIIGDDGKRVKAEKRSCPERVHPDIGKKLKQTSQQTNYIITEEEKQ